jgi:ABC-type branched-subunit amino acid transport system ATPase component
LSSFIDYTVNGLVIGNIYALLAGGLALIFGVSNLINFAHGSVYTIGAYIGWAAITFLHTPLPATMLIVIAYSLSYANRCRVEIARALALKPKLLLLDEPTAGMNPTETAEMQALIATLKASGLTILLVEHKLDMVMALSDRVCVLDNVRENLTMGAYLRNGRRAVADDLARMMELFPRVTERLDQRAGTLSGGEQQKVAMARALMGRPRLICMDEPTLGLSPLFVDRVLELIAEINCQGVTVFMVEQNANLALQIAHEGYVLQTGRIVLQGPAALLRDDPRIREAYLGGAVAA